MVVDFLADVVCLLGASAPIMLFFLWGYSGPRRPFFAEAFQLLMWVMVFTCTLKTILTALGCSPAFPSGHTLSVVTFYGWLGSWTDCWGISKMWRRLTLTVGLVFYGWALWFKGYHNVPDIAAAAFIGASLLTLYKYFRQNLLTSVGWMGFTLWLTLLPFMGVLWFMATIPAHVWMAFYALLSFSVITLTRSVPASPNSVIYRIWFVLSFGIIFGGVFALSAWSATALPLPIASLPWLLAGLIPIWSSLCLGQWRLVHVEWAP